MKTFDDDEVLSLDDLPVDTQFILYELEIPVAYSSSAKLCTAFDSRPRPFPVKSFFSFNSTSIDKDRFLDAVNRDEKRYWHFPPK